MGRVDLQRSAVGSGPPGSLGLAEVAGSLLDAIRCVPRWPFLLVVLFLPFLRYLLELAVERATPWAFGDYSWLHRPEPLELLLLATLLVLSNWLVSTARALGLLFLSARIRPEWGSFAGSLKDHLFDVLVTGSVVLVVPHLPGLLAFGLRMTMGNSAAPQALDPWIRPWERVAGPGVLFWAAMDLWFRTRPAGAPKGPGWGFLVWPGFLLGAAGEGVRWVCAVLQQGSPVLQERIQTLPEELRAVMDGAAMWLTLLWFLQCHARAVARQPRGSLPPG